MLAKSHVEFPVKYSYPKFLSCVLGTFECFSFNLFILKSQGSQKKQEVLGKYDNSRKEQQAESYNRITFAVSYRTY